MAMTDSSDERVALADKNLWKNPRETHLDLSYPIHKKALQKARIERKKEVAMWYVGPDWQIS